MDILNFKDSFFVNADGVKLYRQIYKPNTTSISALVFISHGLFEHCQSHYYDSIIKSLTDINCLVVTHDHYGHGLSEGDRGMISDVGLLVRDVLSHVDETVTEFELPVTVPKFIYGHSLGGLIAVHATLTKKSFFSGIILESPALAHNVNGAIVGIGRCINFFFPRFPMKTIDYDHICRSSEHVELMKQDKLRIHSKVSAMTGVSVLDSINLCVELFKDVDTPVIVGHGDEDLLAMPEGSKLFIDTISSIDKTLVTYPGAKHQLRNEIDNVDIEFSKRIVEWIKERIR